MENELNKIKIFSMPWHIAHQHELLKIPFDWHYLRQHTRTWGTQARPQPENLKWVNYYEKGKYDLAILHVDQQCLLEDLGKSTVFREVRAQIDDIPIIVINHGTPVYPEVFIEMAEKDGFRPTEESGEEWAKIKMKELLGGVAEMVVNSHEAQRMWGWGKAIIHGLDPNEWFDLPKEPRVITFISPAGIGNKYYGRNLFNETRETLRSQYGVEMIWLGQDKICNNWDEYRDFLGRTLIYFNPTLGSPMPRTRTEAMMSGCCVVTTKYQDADTFIKDGVNGFIVRENPQEAAKVLADLIFDYQKALKVGEEGRKTAIKLFNGERFRQEWINLVKEVLNKK